MPSAIAFLLHDADVRRWAYILFLEACSAPQYGQIAAGGDAGDTTADMGATRLESGLTERANARAEKSRSSKGLTAIMAALDLAHLVLISGSGVIWWAALRCSNAEEFCASRLYSQSITQSSRSHSHTPPGRLQRHAIDILYDETHERGTSVTRPAHTVAESLPATLAHVTPSPTHTHRLVSPEPHTHCTPYASRTADLE